MVYFDGINASAHNGLNSAYKSSNPDHLVLDKTETLTILRQLAHYKVVHSFHNKKISMQ
jgi:hypothetical protein